MFNSSLLYEINALRPSAETSLNKIKDDSKYYPVKERLLNLLSFCEPMDVSKVPFNSILREFIGGSIYFNEQQR
jgi:uridine kinase